jgi:hypothetical protein
MYTYTVEVEVNAAKGCRVTVPHSVAATSSAEAMAKAEAIFSAFEPRALWATSTGRAH